MQKIYKEVQEDTGSSQYRRHHKYINNEIIIDGVIQNHICYGMV